MRQVGDIKGRAPSLRFVNYLAKMGIDAEVRTESESLFRVWVHNEDDLARADEYFAAFSARPDDREFDAPQVIRAVADEEQPDVEEPRLRDRARPVVAKNRALTPEASAGQGAGGTTLALILISVAVTIAMGTPRGAELTRFLYFSAFDTGTFEEIRAGQLWRLVTPIFMHGSFLHIFFNMLWLLQLGSLIERFEGAKLFAFLVIALAIACNTSQYLMSGPAFMGMSGVVYGLLGYIWMMSRYQAASAYAINPQTVAFMLVWLVLCLIGLIPGVANTQHVVGILLGLAVGLVRSAYLKVLWRRWRFNRKM